MLGLRRGQRPAGSWPGSLEWCPGPIALCRRWLLGKRSSGGSVLDVPPLVVVSESPASPGARVAPADATVAAVTALALVCWNNLVAAHGWHNRHYVSANLTGTAALLALARLRGVRARELGLSAERAVAGARLGAVVAGVVMVGFVAAVLWPNHRRLLRDARVAGMSERTVVYHAAVRVPLGTVVWEETAFRAVLPALLQKVLPVHRARVANSVLFGVWHVRPTLEALRLNGVAGGGVRCWAAVVSAVVANALVDILLSRLQRATGSLVAPALVHVATNSGGTVAAAVASRSRIPLPAGPRMADGRNRGELT